MRWGYFIKGQDTHLVVFSSSLTLTADSGVPFKYKIINATIS